jgi:carbamoyltransferase
VFYEKPYLKFARTLFDHLEEFPFSLRHFVRALPNWLSERLLLPEFLASEMALSAPVSFVPHHLSHAAHSYFLSGFSEAALLTFDGVGEWTTAARGHAASGVITLEEEMRHPHSLGVFYSTLAEHLGFSAIGGEGKLMGLAAYGKPRFLDAMEEMMAIDGSGGIALDQSYFAFRRGGRMGSRKLVELLGPARAAGEAITSAHCDLAASAQSWLERAIFASARQLKQKHGAENLCLGGGVALNCLANGRLLREAGFKRVFVPPGCGDSGGAIGAALFLSQALEGQRPAAQLSHAYYGPAYSDREILRELKASGMPFQQFEAEDKFIEEVSALLSRGCVMGWFQGAMEFGPRSLGARSILASPVESGMRDRVNELKKREKFRPFAPVLPEERVEEFMEFSGTSPFMLFAVQVKESMRTRLPAITHVDGTARVQTLNAQSNPLLYRLLLAMEPKIGVPVLLNTSFNLDSEPIVCTPADAIRCFVHSDLDSIAIGSFVISKKTT